MSLVALVRYRGGELSLDAKGGITAKKVPADLVDRLRAEKAAVVETLRGEAARGIGYRDSRLYYLVDDLAISARRLGASELASLIEDLDEAAWESIESAVAFVALHRDRALALVAAARAKLPLEGESLASLARSVFAEKPAVEVAPKVDRAAFAPVAQGAMF